MTTIRSQVADSAPSTALRQLWVLRPRPRHDLGGVGPRAEIMLTSMAIAQSTEKLNDAARWTAVLAHDREADGLFVYAVHSTGVYCRPSCPSRRPRRDRVSFFETTAGARQAGFRACLRCKPDATAAADPWIEKIRRACVYLSNVEGHPSLATLAARIGGSPHRSVTSNARRRSPALRRRGPPAAREAGSV